MHTFSNCPAYSFDFGSGITSPEGRVVRKVAGGEPHDEEQFAYRLNDIALAQLAVPLQPEFADLLDIACAVSVADRWSPRTSPNDSRQRADRWHRRISLKIPVRNVEVWSESQIIIKLEALLFHLTDDHWSFKFVTRTAEPRASELQSAQLYAILPSGANVSLFSGGLDSCLGLIHNARANAESPLIATSVVSNERLRLVQGRVLRDLRQHLAPEVMSLRVEFGSSGAKHRRGARESTQRSRGFLYLIVGSLVTMMSGSSTLHLCENGIGAISLPYDMAQTGARNTKAVHPLTTQRMADLVTSALGVPLTIENSGLWLTKAQLCSSLLSEHLYAAAKSTVTCDRFPWRNAGNACGKCTSCLLRRASLLASGHGVIDQLAYEFDVMDGSSPLPTSGEATPLFAMCFQVERLRAVIRSPDPDSSLINEFPEILDVTASIDDPSMSQNQVMRDLVAMYRAYVSEWDYFVSQIPALSASRAVTMPRHDSDKDFAVAS